MSDADRMEPLLREIIRLRQRNERLATHIVTLRRSRRRWRERAQADL